MTKEDKATLILNETREKLATIFANVVDEKINQVEKASSATHKDSLSIAISSASKEAVNKFEEKQKRKGKSFDAAAVEEFRGRIDGNVKDMVKDIEGFSGNKSQKDASQIATMKERLDNYRTINRIEPKKLSSLGTWNLLIDNIDKVTKENINVAEEKLKNFSPDNIDLAFGKAMKDRFHTSLEADLKNIVASQEFTKNLDPETAKAFQQNINAYVAHVLKETPDFSGTPEVVKGKMDSLRKEVDSFKKEVTVDPNNYESNWQKVADFCKSIKLDKLAEFCHDKHLEGLTKEVTKSLGVKLANHPKGTAHDAGHKPFTPDQGKGRQ